MPRGHGDLGSGLGSANDALSKLGQHLENVALAGIKAASAEQELQAANESLQNQVSNLNDTIATLEGRIQASGNIELFEQFQRSARTASKEFEAFVDSVGLSWNALSDRGDTTVSEIAHDIRNGAKTYMGAVREVKKEFAGLLRDQAAVGVDQSELQGVYSALSGVEEAVKTLSDKFTELAENGAIAAQRMEETSNSTITSGLQETSKFVKEMGDGASEAVVPITKLVEQLTSLSDAQPVALSNIATAFRSLSEVGTGNFEPKKVAQISALITELQRIAGVGFSGININLSGLSDARIDKRNVEKIRDLADALKDIKEPLEVLGGSFNFEGVKELFSIDPSNGINNLKVSKASLNNLATYLPAVEKVNAKKIRDIFAIDTSGINSLKVSKASIENVINLARAAQILKNNGINLTLKGNAIDDLNKLTQEAVNASDAVSKFESETSDVGNLLNSSAPALEETQSLLNGISIAVSEFDEKKLNDIKWALNKQGVSEGDQEKILSVFKNLEGTITSVQAKYKEFADFGKHVSQVLIQGVDEYGRKFSKSMDWRAITIGEGDDKRKVLESFESATIKYNAAQEQLVNTTKAQADVEERLRAIRKDVTAAGLNGIGSENVNYQGVQEYANALRDLLQNTDANSTTQKQFTTDLANLEAKYRTNTQALRDDIAASKEAAREKGELVKYTEAQAKITKELEGVNKLAERATAAGISENSKDMQDLREYADTMRELSADLDPTVTKQRDFTATFNELKASVTETTISLERAISRSNDYAKAEAEAAKVEESRARIIAELTRIQTVNSDAAKNGVSSDTYSVQQVEEYANKLYELESRLSETKMTQKEFNEELAKLQAEYKADVLSVQNMTKAYKEQNTHLAKGAKVYNDIEKAIDKYKDAQNDSNGKVSESYQAIIRLKEGLDGAAEKYKTGGSTAQEYDNAVKSTNDALKEHINVLREAGYGVEGTTSKFAELAQQLTRFITPLYLARKAWQTIKEMANVVIELEDAFASLQIVTGATDKELEDFYDTASGIATSLGKSITDIAASIEVFSRLGYALPDATVLAEYATILSNVASVSSDEATTGLTSVIKGFGMHVEQAEHVSDVLISIGQSYAVSAGEMMEAFEKAGAALAATNTSFDKSAALIAAANAAVQNSSTVGTALKTISARIRGSKTELEELGESVDDLANGFSKYAEEIKALTGVNIMVEGTTDQFKDLYDIMNDISAVWGNLTDTQQARTAEILGGTRQLQVIASIINNWSDAQNAYVDAQNAAGEAARANSIYMDTTTAHMNQFKAAFQDLSHTVIDSDLLKGIVDLGTAILKMADGIAKFISSAGGLGPIIASLASLVLIFKGSSVVSMLVKAGSSITSVIAGVKTGIGTIAAAAKGLTGVVTTLDVVSAGAASTVTSMASMASGIGVAILAASALAAIISKVNYEQAQQRETAMQAGDAAAKEGSAIVELVDKYRELNETGASNDAIIAARDEIAEKLGIERNEVEKLTREYGRFDEEIQKLTKDELERQRVTLQGAMNAARESLTASGYESASARRTINYGKEDADSNNRAISSLQDRGFISRSSTGSQGSILNYDLGDLSSYQGVLDAFDRLHQMMNTLIADGNANTAVYQDIYNLYNQLKVGVDAYNNALSNLLTNELQQQYIANGIPKTASDYATMRAEMIAAVAASNDLGMGVEDATAAVDDFLSRQSGLSQFSNEVNNTFNSITSGAEAVALARSQFESMKDTFDDVTDSLKGITDVQNIIADGFVMDAQKAMELAEAYPGILDYATITADGQIKLNEDVANSFIAGKEAEIKAALTAKIAELEGDRALLVAKRDLAQAQLEMANQVARGKSELSVQELQNELNNQNAVTQALIEMGIDEAEAYRAVLKAMSDNTVTFDGNVADTAQNIAANMASASSSMATSFNANVKLMNVGMGVLVGNAHQVAAAVDAMGKGKVAGAIGYTDGGGNGQSINTFNRSFNQRSFGGVGVSYTPRTVQLNNIINQLDTDISGYTSAINAIDSQISALYTILNSSLSSVGSNRTGGGGGGRGGSGGGGGGGGGSGSSSSSKEETWFEKQYKLHQHYLNMDQETTEDFLKWLEKAYKQAYKEGIITLDEYYKYEEEIYKTYQKIKEAAKSTFDALVDYRVKMLQKDRENQKKSINDQLNDLKEFYSKQKELLQKQADDEKYYDEQAEKRKDVNDIKAQIAQLQYDDSAWAAKRRAELYEQLTEAEKSLQDFEDDRALQEALDALDNAYNAEEERLNKEIEAIDEVLNDPEALYNQALEDIQNNTEDLFKAFLLFNKKYGDGDDETIIKMWEEAFKNSEAFKSIFGSYYNDTQIGNYTGYTAPTPPTNPTPPAPSSGNSGGSSSSSSSSSKSSAPSLASGSTVQVKTSATHFSPKSGSVRMASFVPGGQYTVYQTSGNEVLIGRNGVYTGWIYKTDIVGYKKGTKNATPGLHKVNEEGTEAIFTSGSGDTYRMFSGGEKVLPAKATNFLYEFAMAGAEILDKLRGSTADTFSNRGTINQPVTVTMGDIIVNGDTTQATVSEIRRAQREQVNDVLKAFNRYQITLYRSAK